MKNYFTLFSLLLAFSLSLNAQVFHRIDAPVSENDTPLASPWAGGLSAPQWSTADVNDDNLPDLHVFDRDGHVQMIYLNEGGVGEIKYRFAPEYLFHFPPMRNYAMLRDYNQDGVKDIFAYAGDEGVPGFKVFTGYKENGELKFDRMTFEHFPLDVLTIPLTNGTNYTNLNVSSPDYPAVEDIDGDGDLDILGLFSATGNTLVYYRNEAIEQGFTTDTLIYRRGDNCWMGVYVPTLTTSLTLSCDPDSCANACPAFAPFPSGDKVEVKHGASTFLTHDFDGDGDADLLYGDLQYPHINYIENDNTSGEDWGISQDTLYPEYDESVWLKLFPASFKIDIDNDGILEFMFSPNTFSNQIRDNENVFLYENTGTNEVPVLEKQTENIIVRDMIDFGSVSQPAFFDYNADGLMDFVVGNYYRVNPESDGFSSSLTLYKNTGTAEAPAFELVDQDYLNLSQFNSVSSRYAPAFGDMDSDGDMDLLVGDKEGKFFFVQNNGGAGNPADWANPQYNWQFLDIFSDAVPFIFDVNQDDLPDLLIGHKNGTVVYLENIGTADSPSFNPDIDAAPNNKRLGFINTQDQSTTASGYSAPVAMELGDTTFILTGGESGAMEVYVLDPEKLGQADTFYQLSENFGGFYEGTYSRFSFAELDGDEYLEVLIGNHRGGLGLFKSPFTTDGLLFNSVSEKSQVLDFEVFPNPTDDVLNVRIKKEGLSTTEFRIFTPLGQVLKKGEINGEKSQIDLRGFVSGFYFLEIKTGGKSGLKKVVLK